jgi:hypothetical protein
LGDIIPTQFTTLSLACPPAWLHPGRVPRRWRRPYDELAGTRSTWTLVAQPGVDVHARQRASLSDGIARRRCLRQSDCVRQYEIVLPELPYRCLLPSAERPSNLRRRTFTDLPLVSCHHRHCCRIRSSLLRFLGSRKFAALAPSHGVLCSIDGPHSSFVAACSLAPYFKI